jgi:uncharacterized protein YegP (UPF0339 family)
METEYDFTNAEQGKFTRQLNEFDITVHLDSSSPSGKFEVYEDKQRMFRFRLKTSDGAVAFNSDSFKSKELCLNAIKELKENAIIAPTVVF